MAGRLPGLDWNDIVRIMTAGSGEFSNRAIPLIRQASRVRTELRLGRSGVEQEVQRQRESGQHGAPPSRMSVPVRDLDCPRRCVDVRWPSVG